ncbi:myotubularin-related protein 7-like [Sinocyclocheilus rhinocerous]|uniref:myotubularin-related protein 7-like n=1 Tax=Sinocyclocheilus rhinocerous TaxID=307959 RepID=UPI0007BA95EF|nr:PREDICTED: myotubularin-related protein 7-like [Sinocyclocheilus rhinocerous]
MEHIRTPKVENVRMIDRLTPRKSTVGTLYLSSTHTIFVENSEARKETWVLHSLVYNVERLPTNSSGSPLIIRCKNFHVYRLLIPQEKDCLDVLASLTRLSRPGKFFFFLCFSFNPNLDKELREKAWGFINLKAEFSRMGIPCNLWHVTAANHEYRLCDTYPSELFVPKSASPAVIVGSAKFRSRGRLPVLSYFHRDTSASICRSSQPLTGFSARSSDDEQMLQAIMKSNPVSEFMYVVDTRPKLNAMANRAAGKGYENEDHYTNIKLQFIGIENIHVMRNSQQKLIDVGELAAPSMSDFLWGLENSGWLKHIKAVLDAGVFIAKAVAEDGVSVLVHCSDGWDRTAQACSVASVLLDPYYRTIKGLMVLIEKDWVSFGHKFSHRYAHLDGDPKEVSPVMDQFLECVWQLMQQFPCAFEFNERFLIQLHTHIYSCQHGNFICNCQKERRDLRLQERTHSLWPHLWENRPEYTNPLYRTDHSQTQGVLKPLSTAYCFKFWKGMYGRAEKSVASHQSPADCLNAVREESQQLEEELSSHQERLAQLKERKTSGERKKTNKLSERVRRPIPTESELSSPLDYFTTPRSEKNTPSFTLPLQLAAPHKNGDPDDLSTCSDFESGVADLSSYSSSGGDDTKDPDSDEVVKANA